MSVSVPAICEVIFSEAPLLMCNTVKDALKRCGVRPTIVCHHKVAGFSLQRHHLSGVAVDTFPDKMPGPSMCSAIRRDRMNFDRGEVGMTGIGAN